MIFQENLLQRLNGNKIMFTPVDQKWMQHALHLAQKARDHMEVPVGAVLIKGEEVIGEGWNQPIAKHDPSAHAEIVTLRKGGEFLQNYRMVDTTLYVTLEPCIMCMGAILQARIKRLVFGALDPKAGAVISVFSLANCEKLNHHIQYQGGVLADECGKLLTDFFKMRRNNNKAKQLF